jgi:hypothetical protein
MLRGSPEEFRLTELSDRPLVPNQPLTERLTMTVTSGVKRTRREADHISSSSAKVNNARISTSNPYILWKK